MHRSLAPLKKITATFLTRVKTRILFPNQDKSARVTPCLIRLFFSSPMKRSKPLPPIQIPATSMHKGSVIFLHGLGDTGNGWADVAEILNQQAKHLKFILPTAPSRPVTINGGMIMPAWYDIRLNGPREDVKGLQEAHEIIIDLIEKEIKEGIPSNNIILGGFSQGAACSLFTAYQYPKKLAGVVALSGYLPQVPNFDKLITEANKKTKLLMCHGTDDEMIPYSKAKSSFKELQTFGISGEFKSYEGMGHSGSEQEFDDVLKFITEAIPSTSKL